MRRCQWFSFRIFFQDFFRSLPRISQPSKPRVSSTCRLAGGVSGGLKVAWERSCSPRSPPRTTRKTEKPTVQRYNRVMLQAAKESTLFVFGVTCADLPLAAGLRLAQNSPLGFETKNTALLPSFELCNSTMALGIAGALALEGVRKNDRARYYNPTLGRFISEDPIGLGGGDTNFYAYVGDDPVDDDDPFGLIHHSHWFNPPFSL